MNDYAQNKIKFGLGQAQSLTIASWEQTEFNGKPGMKYNTSDGRFFDASPGLIKLLQAIPVQMGQTYTIEKKAHPEMQYGCFYVNGQSLEMIQGGQAPQMATPTPSNAPQSNGVAPQLQQTPVTSDTTESRLKALEDRVTKLESAQLF